jgi:hypothetical protein
MRAETLKDRHRSGDPEQNDDEIQKQCSVYSTVTPMREK